MGIEPFDCIATQALNGSYILGVVAVSLPFDSSVARGLE